MSVIQVFDLGTRVIAQMRWGDYPFLPGVVEGFVKTGAGLRYTIRFDHSPTLDDILADRVKETR